MLLLLRQNIRENRFGGFEHDLPIISGIQHSCL